MSLVAVERSFPTPIAFEDLQAGEDRSAWCREMYDVAFLKSYFSADRQRMICFFQAPDAETVRTVQEKSGLPFDRVWTARMVAHAPGEPSGDAVVVERTFDQPLDEATVREAAIQGAWCLEMYGCRIVSSYLSPDGLRCVCVFGAPDAESVRQSQRVGGLAVDRAWPASIHLPRR